jgi:hypothetical protein
VTDDPTLSREDAKGDGTEDFGQAGLRSSRKKIAGVSEAFGQQGQVEVRCWQRNADREGHAPETIRTTFAYDDFGNVTEEREYGGLSIAGDEVFTFTEYINDTVLWIRGFHKRRSITDGSGQTFAETLSYYDGPDYTGLALGQISRGDLTRQEAGSRLAGMSTWCAMHTMTTATSSESSMQRAAEPSLRLQFRPPH